MYCGYCGKKIPDEVKFCIYCGKEINKPIPKREGIRPMNPEIASQDKVREAPAIVVKKNNMNERTQTLLGVETKNFTHITFAHQWVSSQTNIIIKHFSVSTRTSYGLFANHSSASNVTIVYEKYSMPTGHEYGVDEMEFTNLFLRRNEKKGFQNKYHERYPNRRIVSYSISSNSRSSADLLTQLTGFSTDMVEHVHYFILYRVYSNKTIFHDTQRTTIYSMILDSKGTKY